MVLDWPQTHGDRRGIWAELHRTQKNGLPGCRQCSQRQAGASAWWSLTDARTCHLKLLTCLALRLLASLLLSNNPIPNPPIPNPQWLFLLHHHLLLLTTSTRHAQPCRTKRRLERIPLARADANSHLNTPPACRPLSLPTAFGHGPQQLLLRWAPGFFPFFGDACNLFRVIEKSRPSPPDRRNPHPAIRRAVVQTSRAASASPSSNPPGLCPAFVS